MTARCEFPLVSDCCMSIVDDESNEPKNRSYSLIDLGYGNRGSL